MADEATASESTLQSLDNVGNKSDSFHEDEADRNTERVKMKEPLQETSTIDPIPDKVTVNLEFKMPVPSGISPVLKSKQHIFDKVKSDEASTGKITSMSSKTETLNKLSSSPVEQLQLSALNIAYKEPSWSGICEESYNFEVIKNGKNIDTIDLTTKPFYVFGRLPSCDVTLDHPSLSRYHAVVQYCKTQTDSYEKGWYLLDLDSTHGTWINKHKVPPMKYHRIRVGYVIKLGGSTRLHILQGDSSDQEEESNLSVAEMRELREKQIKEAEVLRAAKLHDKEKLLQQAKDRELSSTCSWGMDDDATDDLQDNPFAPKVSADDESLYIDDPKRALNGFFEREGYDPPEYELSEGGQGKHRCKVALPLDDMNGRPICADVVASGKKREVVLECALEACRILDRHGILRASTHESRKKKKRNWEDDDFYDSDEDTFLDRTGAIEKKRSERMKKAGKLQITTETYDSLMSKHSKIVQEMAEIEAKLEKAKADAAAMESDDMDALDAYMTAIKAGVMDTKTKMKLKRQLLELKMEEQRQRKLINIAKPATLPDLKKLDVMKSNVGSARSHLVGKIKRIDTHKTIKLSKLSHPAELGRITAETSDDIVEEDDDDDVEMESADKRKDETEHEPKVKGPSLAPSNPKDVENGDNLKSQSTAKGPSLNRSHAKNSKELPENPYNLVLPVLQTEVKTDVSDKKASNKIPEYKSKKVAVSGTYDEEEAVWQPPKNQTGDGKTHLNAKFGY